ncbi:MAG: hypothetical protein WBA12_14885 [Catalinimonas sp.]
MSSAIMSVVAYFAARQKMLSMDLSLQYVTDADGTRVVVQIPLKEWEAYQAEFTRLENRLSAQKALKAQAKPPQDNGDQQKSLFSFE